MTPGYGNWQVVWVLAVASFFFGKSIFNAITCYAFFLFLLPDTHLESHGITPTERVRMYMCMVYVYTGLKERKNKHSSKVESIFGAKGRK